MKASQNLLSAVVLSAGLLSASSAAQAALIDRGGGLIYDSDLNITWLANANLAATETFGLVRNVDLGTIPGVNTYGGSHILSDGGMTWGGAMKWIAAMNANNYLGYNDWRLPTSDTCNGFNCTDSEMSHLYYAELGNKGFYSTTGTYQPGYGLVDDPANPNDESLFTNLLDRGYWSGTEYTPNTNFAWGFNLSNGDQSPAIKLGTMYVLAVHTGDVATVPLPAAAWLFGSGLLGLLGVARRKAA